MNKMETKAKKTGKRIPKEKDSFVSFVSFVISSNKNERFYFFPTTTVLPFTSNFTSVVRLNNSSTSWILA